MNNEENFVIQSSKLKVHRANLQTISSYPVRFSANILFSSLLSFVFFVFFVFFFEIKNINIDIHFYMVIIHFYMVIINRATTHHDPPPPTTTHHHPQIPIVTNHLQK